MNTAIIAANFAVWLLYELPNFDAAVAHASFYACTVDGSCHGPEPWGMSEANVGLLSASAHGGGVAFFAHVGGFVFGLVAARLFLLRGARTGGPETLRAPI